MTGHVSNTNDNTSIDISAGAIGTWGRFGGNLTGFPFNSPNWNDYATGAQGAVVRYNGSTDAGELNYHSAVVTKAGPADAVAAISPPS
jgi:hypothetical protein